MPPALREFMRLLPGRQESKRTFLDYGDLPTGSETIAIAAVMFFLLWLDIAYPAWGQPVSSVIAWATVGAFFYRMRGRARLLIFSCLAVATLGEIFCSLIWGLYDYRLLNVPLFVPPGHVLMFLIGSSLAPRLPRSIIWIVPALVAPFAVAGWGLGYDEFGITLFAMFVLCIVAEPEKRLYASMFLVCLVLEVYGTWLGNWTWRPMAPEWGMSNTNPPISAGVFYCLLDFLMLRLALMLASAWRRVEEGVALTRQRLASSEGYISTSIASGQSDRP